MHTTRIAVAAAIAALLSAACEAPQPQPRSAGGPVAPVVPSPGEATPPRPMAAAYTYTCEDLTTIVITDGHPQASATLNSGMERRWPGRAGWAHATARRRTSSASARTSGSTRAGRSSAG